MGFYNFLITLMRLLHIITFYQRFTLCTCTHKKITIMIFFWNFGIVHVTQTFFLRFYRLAKPTTFTPAVMAKPVFTQNILVLTLVLYIVFMANFFCQVHVKRFQSMKVRQLCLKFRVIGRSVGIIFSHFVDAVFYIWK